MKRAIAVVGLFALLGCSKGGGVTGPTPTTPAPVAVAETAPEAPAAPAAPSGTGIHISQNGTITLSIQETLTACLYDATVNHNQNLLNTYKVRFGKNPLEYPDPPKCGDIRLQVDVQGGGTCPPKAHPFDDYRGGLAFIYKAGECPTECTDTEPVVTTTYGDWVRADKDDKCYKQRTVTTTSTLCDVATVTETIETTEIECECEETGPTLTFEELFGGEWLEGKCETSVSRRETCYEHQLGTKTTTEDFVCSADTTKTEGVCKDREISCPCVEEVIDVTETIEYGPWSECTQGGHTGVSASCNETECHQTRDKFKIITTTYTCDKPDLVERIKLKDGHRQCECPAVAACYYTPDCRFGGGEIGASTACPNILKAAMCVAEGGQWSNWNGASNQCKTGLPGIYKSNFRLVPGQSDPACLKFTGPN